MAAAERMIDSVPHTTVLVRYGAIPEVARFSARASADVQRGCHVIVQTHRGHELGTVLEVVRPSAEPLRNGDSPAVSGEVLRPATDADCATSAEARRQAEREFAVWQQRIADWDLDLQLIDLEWTLDRSRLILYVLNERGPESTKLALQAAAAGLGVIEVQPVSSEGLVAAATGGGCGSCGCHG
jgi:cell fate regulator YaaT (PSP1 superfamily)